MILRIWVITLVSYLWHGLGLDQFIESRTSVRIPTRRVSGSNAPMEYERPEKSGTRK